MIKNHRETLKRWWLKEEGEEPQGLSSHHALIETLAKHKRHLLKATYLACEVGAVKGEEYEILSLTRGLMPFQREKGKTPIFVSGRGNELLRILEYCPDLQAYTFSIYCQDYEASLRGNLSRICSHPLQGEFQGLQRRSQAYKRIADQSQLAFNRIRQTLADYSHHLSTLQAPLDELKKMPSHDTRRAREVLHHPPFEEAQALLRGAAQVAHDLRALQTQDHEEQRYLQGFLHAEHLLRIFLLWGLDDICEPLLGLFSTSPSLIVVNFYASTEICQACAHCLFLESTMARVDTAKTRGKTKGSILEKKPRLEGYGIFERLTNHPKFQSKLKDTQFLIAGSFADTPHPSGARSQAYNTGVTVNWQRPIDMSVFEPRIALRFPASPPEATRGQMQGASLLAQATQSPRATVTTGAGATSASPAASPKKGR